MEGGTRSLPGLPDGHAAAASTPARPAGGDGRPAPGARRSTAATADGGESLSRESLRLAVALAVAIYATVDAVQEWVAVWRAVRHIAGWWADARAMR